MRVRWLAFVAPLAMLGCGAGPISSDGEDEVGESSSGADECCGDDLPISISKDVDILFVIDNSGSMGEEQAMLAANVGAFIEVLEDEEVQANYRIGVTTTDNGNPWCPAGTTTPEAGNLVMSSCKTRLQNFLFSDTVDVQDLACNDICTLSEAELAILPTAVDVDANLVARPWLENIDGKTNIPPGTSAAAALECFLPQGVNGCGFESPLESMYLALSRFQDLSESSYGFLRDSAILAIVIVTDEEDCSYNKAWADIFAQDGNKVFWSDPLAPFPTSAVCWNAGVLCTGDPSGYDTCDSVRKGIDGQLGVDDQDAVLHPPSRYIDYVQGIEDAKKNFDFDKDVIVSLIAGVGSDGSVFYADIGEIDPVFQDSFGIGPGCTAPGGVTAVPPVRLRDFTEAFTEANMFSICESDYTPALEAIADKIRVQIKPACYTQCVRDTVPATAIVDPQCTLEQKAPGLESEPIPECKRNADTTYAIDPVTQDHAMPNEQANVCFAMLVDSKGLTADPNDDMSTECSDYHYNLEFALVRRPGFPASGGTAISAECSLSEFPAVDCLNLGNP